ncbi:hypothetical protein STXM2123_3041 [Streptomyces sp. F-3]|nr:hypothetical protein STXM2123_3041 [Streptomyces sp. F-3]
MHPLSELQRIGVGVRGSIRRHGLAPLCTGRTARVWGETLSVREFCSAAPVQEGIRHTLRLTEA